MISLKLIQVFLDTEPKNHRAKCKQSLDDGYKAIKLRDRE